MGRIVLDAELRAKLKNLQEQLEILDEHGTVVGIFSPVQKTRVVIGGVEVPHSEEEIKEFAKETSGRPLQEILADLEKLP